MHHMNAQASIFVLLTFRYQFGQSLKPEHFRFTPHDLTKIEPRPDPEKIWDISFTLISLVYPEEHTCALALKHQRQQKPFIRQF